MSGDQLPAVLITDMDRDQVKMTRDILHRQKGMDRMMVSEAIADMMKFITDNDELDGFLHPPDKKSNQWIEKSKCAII